jgi:hypothetical protein
MYAGHFAAGLVIKARAPQAPTWALMLGVGLLDVLFGPFVVAGIERATLTPQTPPGFSLDYIDWSHSLLMSLVWSALFAAAFARRGKGVMLAVAAAVFSHFVLDLLMHPADLALWPGSRVHLGFGLWRALPAGWWWVELAFILAAWGWYWSRSRQDHSYARHPLWMLAVIVVLHVSNAPWLSPV